MLLTTLALAAALQGTTQGQDFRWTGRLAEGKTLEVLGVNGSIRADAASGSTAEVTATKRSRRGDPEAVEIKVEETADGVTICAIYPNQAGSSCHNRDSRRNRRNNDDNNDVEVDFVVRVPSGARFIGHSVNGDVEAMNLTADAEVSTVNGDASVATRGWAKASTVNGDVDATVGRADWTGSANFRTVNGSVTVTLPGDVNADVRASSVNGDIDTDFPLTVTGRFGPRRLNGTIGRGGRTLALETVNGAIAIRRAGGR
jgi:hypothetical protein